jgi:TPP-dependent indolepyruvate ferredoxin oxidoreductase alpha subunit
MVWRLIYSTTDVIDLFETSDITATPYFIYEDKSQDNCFNEIDRLRLTYYYPLNENEILLFSGGTRTIIPIEEE